MSKSLASVIVCLFLMGYLAGVLMGYGIPPHQVISDGANVMLAV